MRIENVRMLIDLCAEAAHLEQLLPPLPPGITPRCVRVIEQVALLEERQKVVHVSDISEMLDVTRPGITTVLGQLQRAGYVEKNRDDRDSRAVCVRLTDTGRGLYRTAVVEYQSHLSRVLKKIPDEDVQAAARTLRRAMNLIDRDTQQFSRGTDVPLS